MKKLEDIEKIDLSVWLPSGEDSIYLYQKLISTSALRDVLIDSMYMPTCLVYDTEFVNCQFRNSIFYESEFRSCKFTNCLFEKCRLKEQDFPDALLAKYDLKVAIYSRHIFTKAS